VNKVFASKSKEMRGGWRKLWYNLLSLPNTCMIKHTKFW